MAAGLKLAQLEQLVLAANTATAVTGSTMPSYSLIITAEASNSGSLYVGDSNVTTTNGIPIEPGNTLTLATPERDRYTEIDLADIYIITGTSSNKARISYLRRRN